MTTTSPSETEPLDPGGYLLGIDQSATGTAMVVTRRGTTVERVFWADSDRDYRRLLDRGARRPEPVRAGDEGGRTARLDHLREELTRLLACHQIQAAALEDYALAKLAFARFLGEVGAVVRLALWDAGVPFRAYDPQEVKLFATGKSSATKEDVVLAVAREFAADYTDFGKPEGAAGNLADATAISRLLLTELRLRAGETHLEDLPEHRRWVFARTTKRHAADLLHRPFVVRP